MSGDGGASWQIWIDTGGTFTDCLAVDPSGAWHRAKVLSTGALRGRVAQRLGPRRFAIEQNWNAPEDFPRGWRFLIAGNEDAAAAQAPAIVQRFDASASLLTFDRDIELESDSLFEVVSREPAPVVAARLVTQTPAGSPLPPLTMRLGTTRATNALLERRGTPTALFITRGFGDLMLIGDQQRPDLFALRVVKPPPLHELAIEVDERLNADGTVLMPLQPETALEAARAALQRDITVAAIALMHSYRNPVHELALAAALRDLGFTHVSCSSQIAPLIRIVPRAATAIVNAYLAPVVESYLREIRATLGEARLLVMTSAGGLVDSKSAHAKDLVLSGPAGGVVGIAAAGRMSGYDNVIGFDMGGTSTDVARHARGFDYSHEHVVADVRVLAPALAIETVAAGGGSICFHEGGRLQVGPRSAGADPGPACYGRGGPFTITDVNLLLGRLDETQFEIPLERRPAQRGLHGLCEMIEADRRERIDPDAVLEGLLEIANQRMADAIAQVSIRRGYDPADSALVAFGGAGGQHACAVAARLGMRTIIMPADASLLSALGLGHAAVERFAERQVLARLDAIELHLPRMLNELADRAQRFLLDQTGGATRHEDISISIRHVNLRLLGQDHALAIAADDPRGLREAFAEAYQTIYGHRPATDAKPIEVESIRVMARARGPQPREFPRDEPVHDVPPHRKARARLAGEWSQVAVYDRDRLQPGARFTGPCLVFDRRTALVVEPGWIGVRDAAGAIVLQAADIAAPSHPARLAASQTSRLVRSELFINRFKAIANQMGQMLQRTALSTNVKERLDYSCAVLDAEGELLVNAPHMPVHLGSMGMCVRAVRTAISMRPGDVVVTNHPALGGSHLPDLTVITPVHHGDRGAERLLGYVASRAHHAEIGGTRPGSMPPDATTLVEEGVVIAPMRIIEGGAAKFERLDELLRRGPWPSRAVDDNLADVNAQIAANRHGADALAALAAEHGVVTIIDEIAALKARAAEAARAALQRLPKRSLQAVERLDDGSPLAVWIQIADDGSGIVDFTGSSPQHPGNLNATPAIVHSAVIYVLRLLIGESLPLNEGIMKALRIIVPPGLLNPHFDDDPARCPAVAGGNTETSQRLVDTLLKALGVAGCSQGTMNNTLLGNASFSYYETVCGGSGATADGPGADAVHTHMTNTRITDPEILEHRYPLRLEQFAIRRGSGGTGQFRGGDGAVRELTALQPMSLSVLGQHRDQVPYGARGGDAGLPGRHFVIRASRDGGGGGEIIALQPVDGCELAPGDRIRLETPGGGGFGKVS